MMNKEESFEEWFEEAVDKIPDHKTFTMTELYLILIKLTKSAWNHQAKKIESLKNKYSHAQIPVQLSEEESVTLLEYKIKEYKEKIEALEKDLDCVANELNELIDVAHNLEKENEGLLFYKKQWRSIAGKANLKNLVRVADESKNLIAALKKANSTIYYHGVRHKTEWLSSPEYQAIKHLLED